MAKKGFRFRNHSKEFKLAVVKRHLQDGVSVELLALEYQLEPKLIRTWRTLFVNHGEEGLEPKPKGRPKGSPVESFFGWFKDELAQTIAPKIPRSWGKPSTKHFHNHNRSQSRQNPVRGGD